METGGILTILVVCWFLGFIKPKQVAKDLREFREELEATSERE